MSPIVGKTILSSKLASLNMDLAMKWLKPASTQEYAEDHALNQKIRAAAQEIRQSPYFKDIIIEGGTHDDFLDGWEHLETLTNHRWSLPYDHPSQGEWQFEQDWLEEVKAALQNYKVVGAMD